MEKLEAYGLGNNAVSFMRSDLKYRVQHCKINKSFREWAERSTGITKECILGPLLFIIFISEIFLFLQKCDLANYVDASTMYTSDERVSTIIDSLRHECTILFKEFYNNFMVLKPEKCSFMLLGVDDSFQTNLACGDEILKNTKQEKVLGVTLDKKIIFSTYLSNINKDANKKFYALTRVQKYMTTDQKKLIFSSFIKTQFTYFLLI